MKLLRRRIQQGTYNPVILRCFEERSFSLPQALAVGTNVTDNLLSLNVIQNLKQMKEKEIVKIINNLLL